jgi:5-methylthioadenosine/S-adenosylhomocysteine deaminase
VLTQHQSFEVDDTEVDDARFGRHVLLHYADIGTLGPNCTFAHMNVIRDDEVNAVVESGLSIAWNPGNYMNYGIGSTVRTRVSELYRRGVSITPVSDVAKVWGFGEQGFVGYLVAREKQGYLSPEDLMEMATVCGAKAVGLADRAGSLEPGKDADIVIRTNALPEAQPDTNPMRNLVLVSRSKSVDTVIVNGRPVVERGRTTLVDEEDVYALVRASVRRMTSRLGLRTGTSWPEE